VSPSEFVQQLVNALSLGSIYALGALGIAAIFGVMRLVNLAHGDLIVFGAFVVLALVHALSVNLVVAFLIAAPLMFILGYALQHVLLNHTLGKDILPPLLVTFGLSIMLQNGLQEAFSADSRRLDAGTVETSSIPLRCANPNTLCSSPRIRRCALPA